MNNYNLFSKFYDDSMGKRTESIKNIYNIIYGINPKAKKILDVACGTGYLLKYFRGLGFKVTGVDLSKEMLNIASKRVPGAKLYQQDMARLNVDDTFDVITCVFDSINHLLGFNNWKNFFWLSYNHLSNKGIFIFDMNTISKLEKLSKAKTTTKFIKNKILSIKVEKDSDSIFNWNIKILNKNDKICICKENIKETSFKLKKVEGYLKNIFKEVIKTDQNGNKATSNSSRVFFVCLK